MTFVFQLGRLECKKQVFTEIGLLLSLRLFLMFDDAKGASFETCDVLGADLKLDGFP